PAKIAQCRESVGVADATTRATAYKLLPPKSSGAAPRSPWLVRSRCDHLSAVAAALPATSIGAAAVAPPINPRGQATALLRSAREPRRRSGVPPRGNGIAPRLPPRLRPTTPIPG